LLNRYAYVMNKPVSDIDPTGQACHGLMRAVGACDEFMDNGVDFGWNWNGFDVMNIPVVTTTYTWVPPQLVTIEGGLPGGGVSLVEFYFEGYWTTGTQVGAGIDLTASIGVSGSLLSSVGSALDNAYGNALGTVGKVFRGRPPGQSLGACVAQNVNLLTTGSTNGSITTAVDLAVTGMAGLALTHLTFLGMPASQGLTVLLGFMGGITPESAGVGALTVAAGVTGVAAATAGGIGIGAMLGSGANCVSQGVAP
jgi:hypothetical protein